MAAAAAAAAADAVVATVAAAAAVVTSFALRPRLRTLPAGAIVAAAAAAPAVVRCVCSGAPISEPGELGGESLMALAGNMGTSSCDS